MQYGSGPEDDENNFMRHVPLKELEYNMGRITDLIYEINPDIICLQETDFESSRTHLINQPEEIRRKLIAKGLDFPYLERGSCIDLDQERFKYLAKGIRWAYPKKKFEWLFKLAGIEIGRLPEGAIKLHFGNATISKRPIKKFWHEYYFSSPTISYLRNFNIVSRRDERKSYLRCLVDYFPEVQEKLPLYVINTHFENGREENRRKQSKILHRKIAVDFQKEEKKNRKKQKKMSKLVYDKLSPRSGALKIIAGDFNSVPRGSDFDLDNQEPGSPDDSLERLLRHPNMKYYPGIYPGPQNLEDPSQYNTYPSWQKQPDRLFDTIMVSEFLDIERYYVHPAKVSDHLAVVAEITIHHDLVPQNLIKQVLKSVKNNQLKTGDRK